MKEEISERESKYRNALEKALHVLEKGIEVRMQDQWPALQALVPEAIKEARVVLDELEPVKWRKAMMPQDWDMPCRFKRLHDSEWKNGRIIGYVSTDHVWAVSENGCRWAAIECEVTEGSSKLY